MFQELLTFLQQICDEHIGIEIHQEGAQNFEPLQF